MLTSGRSVFATAPGAHYGVGSDVYGRFTAPMREIVGVYMHKETWEKLFGKTWTPPPPWDDDERLREQVIEAANQSHTTQKTLDNEANRRVLDQLFGDDLASTLADRPARPGTVLGISHAKVYVGLDEPPIDVKVYTDHVARQLGIRVGQGRDGMTLRRLDTGARLYTVGDEVRLRVRGHDAERDRWDLELLAPPG
jgi:ribonuclease R